METVQQEMVNETCSSNLGGIARDVGTSERRLTPSLASVEASKVRDLTARIEKEFDEYNESLFMSKD